MKHLFTFLSVIILFASCRKDVDAPSGSKEVPKASVGFYLLNEGNMNMNKASLDYYDLVNGKLTSNIYQKQNPTVVKGLGDVGNDLKIYGGKLYAVINNSNKVEVMDAVTAVRIKQIDVTQCRYLAFYKENVYITSNAGYVVVADTATLTEKAHITTGRNPEQMAIVGNKLYVANSGGYDPDNYERTVSVINLDTRQELKRIDVAVNLHRIVADQYGDLYVTSRGDYNTIPSRLYVIDTKTDQVKKEFPVGASNLAIHNDLAYIYSVSWSNITNSNTITYATIDVKNETLLNTKFISDADAAKIVLPYGIAVNPDTEDVYVTDALDYISPGILYCFDKTGKKKWQVETGDIPAHFAFMK
ncbi:MAG TPA: DUF5074 domain-containing protein [Chitinophaga sp.]|uniref:YncE family protein n=1 Tax=Chitinophaga sp. TaxID=1869181 RepID=UPI002C06A62B|nr:DUF5074 domain-containing protein [Chitinophaga sp.]HVI44083.1 DUF5074 domain-containing protein [Chitinophaga sp.]